MRSLVGSSLAGFLISFPLLLIAPSKNRESRSRDHPPRALFLPVTDANMVRVAGVAVAALAALASATPLVSRELTDDLPRALLSLMDARLASRYPDKNEAQREQEYKNWVDLARERAFFNLKPDNPNAEKGFLQGFTFVTPTIQQHPDYKGKILEPLQSGKLKFLDAGTGMGPDVRQLVRDGVPREQIWMCDKRQHWIDWGFSFWADGEDEAAKRQAIGKLDLLKSYQWPDRSSVFVRELVGKVDVINARLLFHLFNLDDQKTLARNLLMLLRPGPGGRPRQIVGVLVTRGKKADRKYHDQDSWQKLWDEAATMLRAMRSFPPGSDVEGLPRETAGHMKVDAKLDTTSRPGGDKYPFFTVTVSYGGVSS